jgi:lytic cellulose monooxygenase (C1-hydroxylating)
MVVKIQLTQIYGSTCARLPQSNNPITSVSGSDIRCNANPGKASSKCAVAAGGTVTVEMHQVRRWVRRIKTSEQRN